ncbi:unnamed protein product, partial [Rotaria magnacalcarata]
CPVENQPLLYVVTNHIWLEEFLFHQKSKDKIVSKCILIE